MEGKSMRTVKYEDYILMSCDEEDKKYISNECAKSMSVTFMEYFEYILDSGLSKIENRILDSFNLKKWPNYSDDNIIDSTLPKTDMERDKKKKNKDYYIANGMCAVEVLKFIFTEELYNALGPAPAFVRHNYYHILKYIMFDIEQLIIEYDNNINNDYKYCVRAHRQIHTMELHNVLRQTAYGRASFHSYADIEIDASIAVIRQMIELRIRRAFSALAFVDKHGNVYPLDMASVFEILKKHEDIIFPGKLTSIERIYKWSSLYIHSGAGDYAWITYFLEKYLRAFSYGKIREDGSWAYNNGISLSRETFEAIEHELESLNKNYVLLKCKPECEIK